MWHDEGLVAGWPSKIVKGPGLLALLASHGAYLGKSTQQLDFTQDSSHANVFHYVYPKKLCVESILPLKGERVDLLLRDQFDGGSRYRILGYNYNKRKGILEELHQERPGIPYLPANLTVNTGEMMKLSQVEFVMAYALQMATYKLPVRCEFPGCDFIIRSPLDLRKLAGAHLCPVHFPMRVKEEDSRYLMKAAKLLPTKPQPRGLWLSPLYGELDEVPSDWECYSWSRDERLRCGSLRCPMKGSCTDESLDSA